MEPPCWNLIVEPSGYHKVIMDYKQEPIVVCGYGAVSSLGCGDDETQTCLELAS